MLSELGILLQVHVAAAVVALVSGALVFTLPKGGRRHHLFARIYVAAMLITTGVAAFVPATVLEFGDSGWGFFHLFILVGGASSAAGAFCLWKWKRTRDLEWLRSHQVRFTFSYAGLLMAGFAQFLTNPRFGIVGAMTAAQFWAVFLAVNLVVLGLAMLFVSRFVMKGDPRRRYVLRP